MNRIAGSMFLFWLKDIVQVSSLVCTTYAPNSKVQRGLCNYWLIPYWPSPYSFVRSWSVGILFQEHTKGAANYSFCQLYFWANLLILTHSNNLCVVHSWQNFWYPIPIIIISFFMTRNHDFLWVFIICHKYFKF